MTDSATSGATTAPPSNPNAAVDLTGFVQAYKIGPVLQAKALRDQLDLARRNAERVYEQVYGLPTQPEAKAEDDVIQVDSPTTNVTHNYPAPPAPSTLGTLGKVALAFAVSGPIGAGVAAIPLINSLRNRPAAPAAPVPSLPSTSPNAAQTPQLEYDLRLGRPTD